VAADRFTEVTSESWFSRLGGAIKGVLIGLILVVVSFPVLFINEGRAVKTAKSLEEGAAAVVSVSVDAVEGANESKLVHVSGEAKTSGELKDDVFGVSVVGLRLIRDVEMYQWEEDKQSKTKKKLGGGTETTTEYTYEKKWSDRLISSSDFRITEGHSNPTSVPYDQNELVADDVTLGAFDLPKKLVAEVPVSETVNITADQLDSSIASELKVSGGKVYRAANPASPAVGDVRVTFRYAKPGPVSVVAAQQGKTFSSYQTKAGRQLFMLEPGIKTAEAMFEARQAANRTLTWILRGVGALVMFIGFAMILSPLSVFADVIPFIGSLVGMGTAIVSGLLAFSLSLITISIAWVFYRPLIGVPLLAVGIAGMVVLIMSERAARPRIRTWQRCSVLLCQIECLATTAFSLKECVICHCFPKSPKRVNCRTFCSRAHAVSPRFLKITSPAR